MGGVSGSGVHNAKSVCVWFLVNSSDHFVCRVHGESSQNTGNGVSGFGYNSADPGSCTLPYYELDADERLGKFPEGWDLYNTFCGQYGGGYDVNDHCVSNGLAVDVQAAEDVVTVCRKRELQREIPRLQIFRNVIRFPIWKTRGRREYMCTPHYREIPGGLFPEADRGYKQSDFGRFRD